MSNSDLIKWFKDCYWEDLLSVGGKAARLGNLIRLGFPVPNGFCITTKGFELFLDSGVGDTIQYLLKDLDPHQTAQCMERSDQIRALILKASFPQELVTVVRDAYLELAQPCSEPNLAVAVRSSATNESLKEYSFAGQQETFLWIKGFLGLKHHIKRCWASLFSPHALNYRLDTGFGNTPFHTAVGVQKMVKAQSSGVLFTLDPLVGDPSKMCLEANWGFGESVVSGTVDPDHYVLDKVSGALLSKRLGSKQNFVTLREQRHVLKSTATPAELASRFCLSDDDLNQLCALGKDIERKTGMAQDIEWVIEGASDRPKSIHILQSRPETLWRRKLDQPLYKRSSHVCGYITQALTHRKRSTAQALTS